ncbi:hypothetical protein [uncultured Bacteroides sp.]|uniref:hypothetical protein n=1 Tax=uncultured Bacteroides sp. TaxID=162156 RepID=UPI00259A1115|nr:hypothetical protein [uncultured Bacteroides sp.]
MQAFHITTKDYEEGRTYSIENFEGFSNYHQSSIDPEQQRINDVIDDCRPQDAPSRKKSFYTFGKLEYCLGFVRNLDGYKVYQVEINTDIPHPMSLIDFINTHRNLLDVLAPLYWDSAFAERFSVKEYISTEMRIISRISLPPNNCIDRSLMIMKYGEDRQLCYQLCRQMGIQI